MVSLRGGGGRFGIYVECTSVNILEVVEDWKNKINYLFIIRTDYEKVELLI